VKNVSALVEFLANVADKNTGAFIMRICGITATVAELTPVSNIMPQLMSY
jgi:hypothetical protein